MEFNPTLGRKVKGFQLRPGFLCLHEQLLRSLYTTLHDLTRPIIRPILSFRQRNLQFRGTRALEFKPYFSVNATPILHENCLKQYGLIEDIMNVLAARFNFTWSTDLEVSDADGWGLWPKNDAGSVGHCHQQSGL